MKKILEIVAAFGLVVALCGFAFYGVTPVTAFTPTGQALISVTTSSASAVLASTSQSSPAATTAVIANTGTAAAYVMFSATGASAVATTSNGFAIPAGTTSIPLAIRNANYVAAIGTASTSISISTGY